MCVVQVIPLKLSRATVVQSGGFKVSSYTKTTLKLSYQCPSVGRPLLDMSPLTLFTGGFCPPRTLFTGE